MVAVRNGAQSRSRQVVAVDAVNEVPQGKGTVCTAGAYVISQNAPKCKGNGELTHDEEEVWEVGVEGQGG